MLAILPAVTEFEFIGHGAECVEDFVAQIDAPRLISFETDLGLSRPDCSQLVIDL